MNNQFTYPKEKIRFAILTFFFAQGLCMASWASRIPDFKDVFAANYAFYWGLILFMIPVGKFVAIPLAGYLVSKLGSRTMVAAICTAANSTGRMPSSAPGRARCKTSCGRAWSSCAKCGQTPALPRMRG